MQLFFCSTDAGCYRYLFAEEFDKAMEIFAVCVALEKVRPSRVWIRELRPDTVATSFRDHLRQALSWKQQGFGTYEHGRGWRISSVQAEFDRLSVSGDIGGDS